MNIATIPTKIETLLNDANFAYTFVAIFVVTQVGFFITVAIMLKIRGRDGR